MKNSHYHTPFLKTKEILFFEHQIRLLTPKLKDYLNGKIAHKNMSEYIWRILSKWEKFPNKNNIPLSKREEIFWHAFWTVQHLADKEHWEDEITQPKLQECIDFLENKKEFPKNYKAKRP